MNAKSFVRKSIVVYMLAAIAVFYGCKPEEPVNTKNGMQKIEFKGVVTDINGNPLSGVKVITGTENTTTSSDGGFSLAKVEVVNNRVVVKFEKNGYFSCVRSGDKPDKELYFEVIMCQKGNSENSVSTSFESSDGKTVELSNGMKLEIQPASIMRADGSAYSGTVKVDMLFLAPNMQGVALMMPGGDQIGMTSDNKEGLLSVFGMVNVELTDNAGNLLQLKENMPADVIFPLPDIIKDRPASAPLWYFDEKKGVWAEEGEVTLQGDVYKGQVKHFTEWGVAPWDEAITVTGTVNDCNVVPVRLARVLAIWLERDELAPLSGDDESAIVYTGKQAVTYTDTKGEYVMKVPKNKDIMITAYGNGGKATYDGKPVLSNGQYHFTSLNLPCVSSRAKQGAIFEGREDYGGGPGEYGESYYTWAEHGMLIRMDDIESHGTDSKDKRYSVTIYDHFTETVTRGYKEWVSYWDTQRGQVDEWQEDWDTQPFYCPYGGEPFNHNSDYLLGNVTFDEKKWDYYKQDYTMTVAGKVCKVYKVGGMIQASWEGILMYLKSDYDDEVYMLEKATINVPNSAFSQTFDPSWIK